ncbi:MAG: glycerate kinase type-2 family protein [Nitrososphaeria archaeon]
MLIENMDQLTSKGNKKGRKIVLDVVKETLEKVNYHDIIKDIMQLSNDCLKINGLELNLRNFEDVYVVGGGKNSSSMTQAIEEILGDRIKEGVVVEKKGCGAQTKRLLRVEGDHPIPNHKSVKAAEEVLRIVGSVGKNDLLLVCVSGGWTALTSKPPKGISLEEHRKIHELLLKSGMTVEQMNIIRNHISQLGRGKIPMLVEEATVVGLIAVDEVEGKPWGPTTPDSSRFSDAIKVLQDFDLLDTIPKSIREYLQRATASEETPTISDYVKKGLTVHNIIVADNVRLCELAQETAARHKIHSFIMSTGLRGEARHVGTVIASIANEIAKFNRPFSRPCLLIFGGETTVTIENTSGEGGRNQELALSAAQNIPKDSNVVIASIATDGTDGPTDIAGAIVDSTLIPYAKEMGIDVMRELNAHNSSYVFKRTENAIYARNTGTNLMDLIVAYIE